MGKIDVLCFGGEDWWYKNQAHIDMQLMRRFSKLGTVLYVNSIVMQKPNINEGKIFFKKLVRKTKSVVKGLKMSHAGFWVYSPFTLPVHHIGWLRRLNEIVLPRQLLLVSRKLGMWDAIIWVACPVACNTAIKMKKGLLVYQRTDRYEDYPNVDHDTVRRYDQQLKAFADMTLFVNKLLYEQEYSQCKKAFFLDHGVDFDLFALADQDRTKPQDITSIPKPIAGYFGELDEHKLDICFLENMVDLLPKISFVFVGNASPKIMHLGEKKNVWLLGKKSYEQIPHYGKCFDVAILPWTQNKWTEAANPLKIKEYLALGKPLICTPVFTQIEQYRDVAYVANTPEEFAHCIVKALNEDSPKRIAARRKKVQYDTWDSKAELVLHELFDKKN